MSSQSLDLTAAPYSSRRSHWNNQLERHGFAIGDRAAVRFEGRTTTWRELRDRVRALADAMARRGVGFGDRVAVLMSNRPEFLETVLAANRLGAIAVPVNFRLTGPEIAYVLEDSGSSLLFVDEESVPAARDAATHLPRDIPAFVVGAGSAWDAASRFEDLVTEAGEQHEPVDVPEGAPALIMYTSGTTGRPKGAVLSHQNLGAQSLTIVRAYQLTGDDEINLVASPLFHIGAIGSVAPVILIGGTLVILPSGSFDAQHVLGLLASERVTSVFLVPTQWQALCDAPNVRDFDLSHLRVTSWGAAPSSDSLLRRMAEEFPDALNVAVFGQTEMSPVTCVLAGKDALRKLGSVGKPVATTSVRVVDGDMVDVAPGQIGEIVYQGPSLMEGYWRNPEATAAAFHGGWFHSGDLVRVDEDGFIYVVDRAKDMIISGGENIYCAEVENALAAHPDIAEVSIIGRAHPKWGETPVAVVSLRDPAASLDIADLRAWARDRLAAYKLPTALELVQALPRNASGKVVKGSLREQYAQGAVE
ncbi:MAG: long-chain-fatty-acid--CoA ligase [Aeromicrobium sp.]